jgi:hypothetical protein
VLEKDGEDQLDRSCGNGVNDERNIRKTIKGRKANWSGHVLRRNCLLKSGVEGRRIEVIGRRGRRRKQLLDDLEVKKGCWKLKKEALGRTI